MRQGNEKLKETLLFAREKGYPISLQEIDNISSEITALDEYAMMAMNGLLANNKKDYTTEHLVFKSYEIAKEIIKYKK